MTKKGKKKPAPREQAELFVVSPETVNTLVQRGAAVLLRAPRRARMTVGRQSHAAVHPVLDKPRLENQEMKVLFALTDKKWHTLFEISAAWGIPHGSVGSQIRNLRVDGWEIEKVRVGAGGTWAYRLVGKKAEPLPKEPAEKVAESSQEAVQ